MSKPFVKWAGGKRQLINTISSLYPESLGHDINKFCEPFIGGGAVLFDVLSKYPNINTTINDINYELINTYNVVKYNINGLIEELYILEQSYHNMTKDEQTKFYYSIRDKYNSNDSKDEIYRASLFIFLNRTCFNGLYRVNSDGKFNVPIGAYNNPCICDTSTLLDASVSLKHVQILCGDYRNTLPMIDEKTFVYLDPPYRPISKTSNFVSYTKDRFDEFSQIELYRFVKAIDEKGARFIISNSDSGKYNITDNFFDKLFSEYNIIRIYAQRNINSVREGRAETSELIITNFE